MSETILAPSLRPVPLGQSGLSSFPVAWGMWRLARPERQADTGEVIERIEAALEAGITLFDTADIYGADTKRGFGCAEALLGEALARRPDLRKRMTIATKGGIRPGLPYNSSPDYLEAALDASLRRMGVESVELYQIHRRDFLAHPRDVAAALAKMVDTGKVGHVGVSNYSPAEIDAMQAFLPFPLVSTQPEFSAAHYHPLYDGTLDQAMARDMAVLAWSPLGGGGLTDSEHPVGRLLAAQGQEFGVDAAAAALSWIMVYPARIIPIIGSQNASRIKCVGDAFLVQWTRGAWYAVLEAARGQRMP